MCIIMEKYPRRLENLKKFEGYLNFKFCVVRLTSVPDGYSKGS